ncbi:Protein-tyrosine-phosphatase [Limimonas halophila]|uniref:Protein-tyrosine-phosphatase n=1 Tax=Limimonas halophila TaxID=1082479 RepID=A0A1G7QNK5_9PROT|nr:low molecular weight phosphatase family protein [Limimonas halophila]SDF99459.1 Protein-tyrosine-phosphatase [Limimonas halophila]
MRDLPDSVLFACTQNAVRSPMAESMLKYLAGSEIYVDSVGLRAGEIDPFVVEVMGEVGIDLSKHCSKTFDQLENSFFDLVISLSPEAQHRAVEMTRTMACEVEFWRTLDPTVVEGSRAMRVDIYRQVRDSLFQRIKGRFDLTLKAGS